MARQRRAAKPAHHQLRPADFLHFVETDEFAQDWKDLGLDVETDLWALEMDIMAGPELVPVIPGTGGLRKGRFAPEGWDRGKSGGVRVCYAYFKAHWTVLLVMAYAKGRQDDLTSSERAGIKKYLSRIQDWLDARNG